jgi:hypothetical protein
VVENVIVADDVSEQCTSHATKLELKRKGGMIKPSGSEHRLHAFLLKDHYIP